MPETLEVSVNRERPNALEVPDTFESTANFVIVVENAGKPVHLHINCDDDLLAGLTLETGNHYIPREGHYELPVTVDPDARPFRGKCRISIAYGSETRYVEIRVPEPETPETVAVDDSLSQPTRREPTPTLDERIVGDSTILGLIFLALLALIAGGVILASITTPIVGVIVVIVVILLAVGLYLLIEEA